MQTFRDDVMVSLVYHWVALEKLIQRIFFGNEIREIGRILDQDDDS